MSSRSIPPPNLKSKEELYFWWYLLELKDKGFISDIRYEPQSFDLCESVRFPWIKKMKTKDKVCDFELLKGMRYTPDFTFVWELKATGIFTANKYQNPRNMPFKMLGKTCWVDVKGTFSRNESYRIFPMYQKMMWKIHGIFVEKIVMPTLYVKTFTPGRFLLTDKTMKPRTINFETQTLNDYVNNRLQELFSVNTRLQRETNHKQLATEPV